MVNKLRRRSIKKRAKSAGSSTSPKPPKKARRSRDDDDVDKVQEEVEMSASFTSPSTLSSGIDVSSPTDSIAATFGSLQLAPTPTRKVKRPPADVTVCLELDKSRCGDLLAFGEGDTGQLGMGKEILRRKKPQLVNIDAKVVQVSAGGMHSLALDRDGKVYSWGCNDDFALGRITATGKSGEEETDPLEFTPHQVQLPKPAVQISAGDSHSACLLQDGSVYIWGAFRNTNGLLGLQQSKLREKKPVRVDLPEHICKISSGCDHVAMLSTSGHVYSFGNAQQGQLGRVGRCSSDYGGRTGLGKLLEPDIVRCQAYRDIRKPKKFIDIWCGPYSTFVKDELTNRILACGLNNFYQLGHIRSECHYALVPVLLSKEKNWTKIAAGLHHTLALNDAGEVYAFGRPEYGRLGLGPGSDVVVEPCRIERLVFADDPVVDIACGSAVSFAITRSGKIFSWGMGTNCQTGHGEDDVDYPTQIVSKQLETRSALQVSAGGQHTLLIARQRDNGGVFKDGNNNDG